MSNRHAMRGGLVVALLMILSASALSDTATFGRGQSGDYAIDKIDMVSVRFTQWEIQRVYGGNGETSDCYLIDGDYQTSGGVVLIGFADLFNLIPPSSAGLDVAIEDASLELLSSSYQGAATLTLSRMTTDWLTGAAGTNQDNVGSDSPNIAAGNVEWTTNPDGLFGNYIGNDLGSVFQSFGSGDYTAVNAAIEAQAGYGSYTVFDVTSLIQDAYAAGENFGFVLQTDNSSFTFIQDAGGTSGTFTSPTYDPMLTITYSYPLYGLTVVSGSGSGEYPESELVAIAADAPPAGRQFAAWVGDVSGVDDVSDSNTSVTIGTSDVTVTATYGPLTLEGDLNGDGRCDITDLNMVLIDWGRSAGNLADPNSDASDDGTVGIVDLNIVLIDWGKAATYMLTVNSGSGDGLYDPGSVVAISADAAATGLAFNVWAGDIATVADVNQPDTTVTIPTQDVIITPAYSNIYYALTVNSGSGDGSYTQGRVVNISADAAASGQQFNAWIGDTSGIASVTSANTTITMPASNATITATYQATGGAYTITVVGGSPSGSYNVGDTVYITASGGAPDSNELFTWSGNIGALAAEDVTNWNTSFVIPSAWPVGYYNPWTITANYVANDNPGIKTDYGIYPEPPLPTLPAAGGKFTDPVFGTTIMRVTDELDGNDNHSAIFTQFQVFNADTTRFFVLSDGVPTLYDLNKTAFTISNKRNLFQSSSPGGVLRVWDLNWDTSNPDVIYAHTGVKIYSYNVATDTYTLVVDLASMLGSIPGAANMSFMHSDDYSDRFAFMVQDSGWAYIGSAVYDKSQNQVIYQGTQIPHDSTMDKSGKWFATTPEGEPGGIALRVVEMANTSNVQDLTKAAPDWAPGHCDFGWETVYGAGINNTITARNLNTPHTWNSIFAWGDWSQAYHVSNRDYDDNWIVVSSYSSPIPYKYTSTATFKDEIFQVKTDGSGAVRRLAHHRSWNPEGNVGARYYDFPLASISPDGQFIIYNSNWEDTRGYAKRDVFILKIPVAP